MRFFKSGARYLLRAMALELLRRRTALLVVVWAASLSAGAQQCKLQTGVVYPLLYHLGLDDLDRHTSAIDLVNIFSPTGRCDTRRTEAPAVGSFVLAGWNGVDPVVTPHALPKCLPKVHIFEPNPRDHAMWLEKDRQAFTHEERKRIVYPAARGLGAAAGRLNMSYGGMNFETPIVRADTIIEEHVFMLSMDVHGAEVGALHGMINTIQTHGVDVILVETVGNLDMKSDTGLELLSFLARHEYVIFDFVPIRFCHFRRLHHNSLHRKCSLQASDEQKLFVVDGPSAMGADWYASNRSQHPQRLGEWYHWFRGQEGPMLQTDLLAVHASYLTATHLRGLYDIAAALQSPGRANAGQGARPMLNKKHANAALGSMMKQCSLA